MVCLPRHCSRFWLTWTHVSLLSASGLIKLTLTAHADSLNTAAPITSDGDVTEASTARSLSLTIAVINPGDDAGISQGDTGARGQPAKPTSGAPLGPIPPVTMATTSVSIATETPPTVSELFSRGSINPTSLNMSDLDYVSMVTIKPTSVTSDPAARALGHTDPPQQPTSAAYTEVIKKQRGQTSDSGIFTAQLSDAETDTAVLYTHSIITNDGGDDDDGLMSSQGFTGVFSSTQAAASMTILEVTESIMDIAGDDRGNKSNIIMHCEDDVPTTEGLFRKLPALGYVVLSFYFIFLVFVIGNFIETAYFIKCHFKDRDRRRRTIWLVAIWPVYSFTAFIGALIPRSATIVNLCSSAYFGSCLFQLVELYVNYMGGMKRMFELLGDDKQVSPRSLPVCCCCICLPFYTFTKRRFIRLSILVLQVSVIRPLLMFVAAALWANGTYHAGKLSPWNAYLYITVLNLMSTMPAMWGLMQLRNGVLPELQPIRIAGKTSIIQMTMISTVVINLTVGILTHNGVVLCSDALPASARGSVIYHGLILTLMVPFSIIGRLMYRRAMDGTFLAGVGVDEKDGEMVKVLDQEIVTMQPGRANNNAADAKWGEEVEMRDAAAHSEKQAMA